MTPRVAATAYVAPTALVCGDVEIGEECRIMFGAVLVAEDAPVRVADRTVIMENAVVRAWPQLPVELGHDVMIGPASTSTARRSTTTPSSPPAHRSSPPRTSASPRSSARTARARPLPVGPPNADARRPIWRRYVDEITNEDVDLDAIVRASELFTPATSSSPPGRRPSVPSSASTSREHDSAPERTTFSPRSARQGQRSQPRSSRASRRRRAGSPASKCAHCQRRLPSSYFSVFR
jgi:hypothetical protein